MVPVMFAMVPLVAVAEVMRAYLNASYAFVAPALMTVVLNGLAAVVILAGPLLLGMQHKDIHLVAFAFLSGAVAQAVFMWVMAARRGLRFQPAIDLRDKELRGIGSLSIRPLAAAGLNPVARVGEQLIVSFLPVGSITILNYGYMVVSAVGGTVFFRSVIVALLPRLTDAYNRDDREDVRRFTRLGMQVMLAISLPLTAFMAVLARARGARGLSPRAASTRQARNCSARCSPCTRSAWWARRCNERCSHRSSRGSTRARRCEPPSTACIANMVLLPLLVLPFGLHNRSAIIGVALAFSLAVYVNVGHAWYHLSRSDGPPGRGLLGFTLRLVVASGASADRDDRPRAGAQPLPDPRPRDPAHPHPARRADRSGGAARRRCTSWPAARSPAGAGSSVRGGRNEKLSCGRDRARSRARAERINESKLAMTGLAPYTDYRQGVPRGTGLLRRRDAPRTDRGAGARTNRGDG